MRSFIWVLALLPASLWAIGPSASDLSGQVRAAGLDADECYRVRDLNFSREDVHFYFNEGHLIFGKPVNGRRLSAVFSAEVEGGDGEMLVMPPSRSERLSLATFTESPNLSEHFRFALMVFSDDSGDVLLDAVRRQDRVRPSPEMGMILRDRWSQPVANLTMSFGNRIIYELLSDRPLSKGFFYAAVQGRVHGNFDVVYDPTGTEQIQIGQIRHRDDRYFFNVWTSFQSRAFRTGARKNPAPETRISEYAIEATLERNLDLSSVTRAKLTVKDSPQKALYFELSPKMEVEEVTIDGQPCNTWQRDSLRENLFRGGIGVFLIIPPEPLAVGDHFIEVRHRGRVVSAAGNGVYYVSARSSWYPFHHTDFSHFDITFRYPSDLQLVFTGEVVDDRTDGEWRITRRKTENPIRFAGFNVGRYEQVCVKSNGYKVQVYANRDVEEALQPRQEVMLVPRLTPPVNPRRRPIAGPEMVTITRQAEKPDPTLRLESLAEEVSQAYQFMADLFGPPPAHRLMVSPIPGTFGQGFPGLLYLSTLSYLQPKDRPEAAQQDFTQVFFNDLLHAHETAHQWWGNTVTVDRYQDGWLMEALANYSAMLLLEKNRGPEALETALNYYRNQLVQRTEEGKTLESAGPLSWGPRLNSSHAHAWRPIIYGKGSWVLHMLRRRIGDENFSQLLGDICRKYRFQTITVSQFKQEAVRFLPDGFPDRNLDNFFDQWVDDIGVPRYRFSSNIQGKAPRVRVTGKVTQDGVAKHFSAFVPVHIIMPDGEKIIRWIRTSEEPEPFDITLKTRPSRIVFNPGQSVLTAPN